LTEVPEETGHFAPTVQWFEPSWRASSGPAPKENLWLVRLRLADRKKSLHILANRHPHLFKYQNMGYILCLLYGINPILSSEKSRYAALPRKPPLKGEVPRRSRGGGVPLTLRPQPQLQIEWQADAVRARGSGQIQAAYY
jgi:hypothetical protein